MDAALSPSRSGPPANGNWNDSSDEEEYSLSGVRLHSQRGGLGKRARVAPIPVFDANAPALVLNPDDRLESAEDEVELPGAAKGTARDPGGAIQIQPFVPRNDPELRRRRSELALVFGQEEQMRRYGSKPRLVRDPETGVLLPRDEVVAPRTQASPTDDPAAPAQPQHYSRSLEIVQSMRRLELLKKLESAGF